MGGIAGVPMVPLIPVVMPMGSPALPVPQMTLAQEEVDCAAAALGMANALTKPRTVKSRALWLMPPVTQWLGR
jgi:hypothetical protein